MQKRTITTYLSLHFFIKFFFSFHAAVYVAYLLEHNLSLFQVNITNLCFMFSVFLLEIPTGAIADIFGRKTSFVLSNIVTGLGFIVYGVSQGFIGFISAEIIIAIGVTLSSGSFEAWMVDTLKYHNWDGKMVKIFHNQSRIESLAKLLGGLLGAYIGIKTLSLPFIVSGCGLLIVSLVSFFVMEEKYFKKEDSEYSPLEDITKICKDSIKYGLKNKTILLVTTVVVIMNIAFQPLNMYWQPHFKPFISDSQQYFGFIWVGIVIFSAIGNELVKWFSKKFKNIKLGYVIVGTTMGFMIFLACSSLFVVSLVGYMFHEISRGLEKTYTRTIIQKNIPSKKRATIKSFVSMSKTGAAGIGLIVFGLIADKFTINVSWIVAGLVILIVLPFLIFINGKLYIDNDQNKKTP